jgi:DNA sulfur modification protein DndC
LGDQRPWIVGFSGGKDSTALLQLVFQALTELPRERLTKSVHVVSNDTRVEIPQVSAMVVESLAKIDTAAQELALPIKVAQTRPDIEDTFFVNLIGRGYPSPNSHFRWCTERMKIDPTSRYIKEVVDKHGEVIILLGARKAESGTRLKRSKAVQSKAQLCGDIPPFHALSSIHPSKIGRLRRSGFICSRSRHFGGETTELFSVSTVALTEVNALS